MKYPIVIHKDPDSDYGVLVPDVSGCFSSGSTFDEAFTNAKDAIEFHLKHLVILNKDIPIPGDIESHLKNPDYEGGFWGVVDIDLHKLSDKTKRYNITLPELVGDSLDKFANDHHLSRSKLIMDATLYYINHYDEKFSRLNMLQNLRL